MGGRKLSKLCWYNLQRCSGLGFSGHHCGLGSDRSVVHESMVQANCFGPMGVEDGSIKDSQMHGSTYIDQYHHGRAARLNSEKSWTPDPLRDIEGNRPYLKIELVSATSDRSAGFQVHGIATQGDEEFKTWVTKVGFHSDERSSLIG